MEVASPAWLERDLDGLLERVARFHLYPPKEGRNTLLRFCTELIQWNRRHGLLSRGDIEHVVRKHIAASLGVFLGVDATPKKKWVDIGTGAGFPGLILKVWQPDLDLVLIESAHKRCVFLQHVMHSIGIEGVRLHQARAETVIERGDYPEGFDVLLARAVADLRATIVDFGPLVRSGGRIVTFKGPHWQDEVRTAAIGDLQGGAEFQLEECICVPWTTAHLLLIRKR